MNSVALERMTIRTACNRFIIFLRSSHTSRFAFGIAKQIGRVEDRHQRNAAVGGPATAQSAHRFVGAGEPPRSRFAEGHDHIRLEEIDLAVEVGGAGRNLVILGVPVARRSALDDIGDINLVGVRIPSRRSSGRAARPAWPTNGRPVRSSSAPGPSPMNITPAFGSPSPKTTV